MPETDAIPVSASVVSTGKGIRYIGNHCYAFSGTVGVPNVETDLINTVSGSGYILCKIQFNHEESGSNDYKYRIRLNGFVIQAYIVTGSIGASEADNFIPLLIPPFTELRCTAENVSGSSSYRQVVSLTGRVYGAV
jgi:hypothetical protein